MDPEKKDWLTIAPCDVCRFRENDYCPYQGKKCVDVNLCGYAAQALREAGYKNAS